MALDTKSLAPPAHANSLQTQASAAMTARAAYVCQLQGCNALLIFVGLACVGLAGSQFSRVEVPNYRDIDLRLLNWIHVLSGLVGIYSLLRNHGSIVTKTLYCYSAVIGIATAVFYGFTTYRVVWAYRGLKSLENVQGFQQEFGETSSDMAGAVAISAIMIGCGAVAGLVALIALVLLDKLVVVAYPVYPITARMQEEAKSEGLKSFASVAVIKLLLGLGTLGLCAFLEYEHEKIGGTDNYIKIALDHISAMLVVISAGVDILAVKRESQAMLNIKVSLALSVVAATWCLKTVDNSMMPYYKNDLRLYYLARDLGEASLSSTTAPRYIVVVVHGVLIGCFGLLFVLCCISAVLVGAHLSQDYFARHSRVESSLTIQSRLLSLLHLLWAAALFALAILGLLDLPWRGEFWGADLVWVSLLFATTALLSSYNPRTHMNARFIMNVISLAVATEKMCASINLVYQYSTYPAYVHGNRNTFAGQIVLGSIQCGVYAAEVLTSLTCAILFGRAIVQQPNTGYPGAGIFSSTLFALGTLFYGVVITGDYVVFELGKWRYSEVPMEVPFFRLGNGPLGLATFIVQLCCMCQSRLLVVASILQIVIAALAQFTISSAITNQTMLQQTGFLVNNNPSTTTVIQVAIILAAAAVLACVVATFCNVACALRSSYLLHHKNVSTNSTVVAPLEEPFGSLREASPASQANTASPLPVPVQQMEEQSVYWSADENPFFYHTSKRYYGQPYQIESGFYGYALAGSQSRANSHAHRRMQSSAVQTQLGHAFDE